MLRPKMGPFNSKSESRVNTALKEIESLNKTGKQQVQDILQIFLELDNKIFILKSEQRHITRDLQKHDLPKSSFCNEDKKIIFEESETQTENDKEMSLSIENDTLKHQNNNLEKEIAKLKANIRQDETSTGGSIITTVACKALFPDDKYFPVGSDLKDQYVMMQKEYEKVLKEKDIAIRDKDIAINKILEKESTITEFKGAMEDKIIKLEEQEKVIRNLKQQIEQNMTVLDEKDTEIQLKHQHNNEKDILIVRFQGLKDVADKELATTKKRLEQAYTSIKDLEKQLLDKTKDLERLRTKLTEVEGKFKDVDSQRGDAKTENDRLKMEIARFSEAERCNRDLNKQLDQLKQQYKIREDVIEERKSEIIQKDEKLKQKDTELNVLQKEMKTVTKKLRNELSLESVNVQNAKARINELEQSISKVHHELEEITVEKKNMKSQQINLTEENLRLQNELDNSIQLYRDIKQEMCLLLEEKTRVQNELNNMQQNVNITLEENTRLNSQLDDINNKINCISSQNDALLQENEFLKQEREKLAAKTLVKRCISFHTVLKQPQSEQAESGIVSLLQQQLGDVTLEIIPESKRSKNVPLLVVLYNLSRITDDVRGALYGIEASSDVALVILHPKEVVKASEHILTHVDFKKLGIIVDISFISAKGIISNDVTSGSIQQLAKFINTF